MITKRRIAGVLAGAVMCVFFLAPGAGAITPITQGYLTKEDAPLGAIMSLQADSADYVDRASTANANNILGVVVSEGNSLLTLSDGRANQVQVATSGVVQVLVSNINGEVRSGDAITASPIKGVGMKATTNAKVVGIAQEDLSGNGTTQQSYSDKRGGKHTVLLGEVPVLVNPAYYYKQPDKTVIPAAVQNIANAVAGKAVNSLPVIISLTIFIVTMIVIVSIIYSMIHSSIISVGRNPMSQAAIYRNLIQMSGLIIIILAVAVVSIYMILTKVS